MQRLVFWQEIYSQHQSALLEALSDQPNIEKVELVISRPQVVERAGVKWRAPKYSRVVVHHEPNLTDIERLIQYDLGRTVHIFSGIASDALGRQAMQVGIKLKANMGIMAEAGDWNGFGPKKYLRLLKYILLRLHYGRHAQFILAIGQSGVHWYKRVGYNPRTIFPFAYYVDVPTLPISPIKEEVHLLFVGRAVEYKGVDILIKSLAQLKDLKWSARLITEGERRGAWEALAGSLGLTNRLIFTNFEPGEIIAQRMAEADVLILPNKGDEGWGVVVNEALLQGTPVICTTRTGAKDLIAGERGAVVEPTAEALSVALRHRIEMGPLEPEMRQRIAAWAQESITGHAGAKRLLSILEKTREV